MSSQAPKDETLQKLCRKSNVELVSVFRCCSGRELYARSLKTLVKDLAEEEQLRERSNLVSYLQSWIAEAQNHNSPNKRSRCLRRVKDIKVLAFGSSVMGISSRDGDLDISLEGTINDRSISPSGRLSDATRSFKADLLTEVHEALRWGHHFSQLRNNQLIRHAKVPVSKFVERRSGIQCDLSIGNTTGVFKSILLSEVLGIDERVRDLVVIVKKWAKANRINDPANGSFNSYCLTLLVLSFAQARSPPLIPPFRELFPGLRDVVCESQKHDRVDLIKEIDYFRLKAAEWMERSEGPKNTETLCELLCAFFLDLSLFATHSQLLHYTAEGVSKSNSRPTCSCWDSGFVLSAWDAKALKRYQLFVEDPFEAKDNCARTLATQDWWRIVKTLQETVNLVQEFAYACPSLQPEKWLVLWSFLFQNEPLPEISDIAISRDCSLVKSKALMPLHKECLIDHLNKFKASDKKFIAVSYSWWSKEFKQFVLSAIDDLDLFQGKGPKKKVIISKADNIKDDMVEHAVNSTLRARKNHNLVVDPYQCVMKQRLAEFLRCTIRYHKFRASYFDDETKEWLLQCVVDAGLKGKYVDGDLHLERPADLRPANINGMIPIQRKDLSLKENSPQDEIAGPIELEEASPQVKLTSFALEDEDELDDDIIWDDNVGTETCASSCDLGTSVETIGRSWICYPVDQSVRVQLDVGFDEYVKVNFVVSKPPKRQRSRKMDEILDDLSSNSVDETVKLTMTATDSHVSIGLETCSNGPPVRGLLAELATVAEESHDEEENGLPHPSLLANDLHERNAEILRLVFLDLFDSMEKLQDTDSFRGEIEIDPTEYVVPVSWVRQQVRDIARHLFLEIVVHNKRRRAMKIRIRKRARSVPTLPLFHQTVVIRFEDSDSEDEWEYNRHNDTKRQTDKRIAETSCLNPLDWFIYGGQVVDRMSDEEDHVTRCLMWIKGMKREKSMQFQAGIYPPSVLSLLKERAEELGLIMEVSEDSMHIRVNPNNDLVDETPRIRNSKMVSLNEKVQVAIKEHFAKIMVESRSRGVESFAIPTKGYFMRPDWVAKQISEIGKRTGFSIKERDGAVELHSRPNQGLHRYFCIPESMAIPQGPRLLPGTQSSSYSGGFYCYPNMNPLINSHPVSVDQWSPQQSRSNSIGALFQEDYRDCRNSKPQAIEHNGGLNAFSRSESQPNSDGMPRRHRRSNQNGHRSTVRAYDKMTYWENGDSKGRGRGRGKGRRGRGRNGLRPIGHEDSKSKRR